MTTSSSSRGSSRSSSEWASMAGSFLSSSGYDLLNLILACPDTVVILLMRMATFLLHASAGEHVRSNREKAGIELKISGLYLYQPFSAIAVMNLIKVYYNFLCKYQALDK